MISRLKSCAVCSSECDSHYLVTCDRCTRSLDAEITELTKRIRLLIRCQALGRIPDSPDADLDERIVCALTSMFVGGTTRARLHKAMRTKATLAKLSSRLQALRALYIIRANGQVWDLREPERWMFKRAKR